MNKLAVSNIGWGVEQDIRVYEIMKKYGYSGLEIAPTRIFPVAPYEKKREAATWSAKLKSRYGISIPSMQSIWYGRKEKVFGGENERKILVDYTQKAIDFAVAIDCKNLVFGCPGNREIPEGADPELGILFFREIGNYACAKGTVIGFEANPQIYNTNYMNDTVSALELIERVDSKGFLLNLDIGTMIENEEPIDELTGKVKYINHVHISEPKLKPIKERPLHKDLKVLLETEKYQGYVSIEMGKTDDIKMIESCMEYVRGIFG